MDIFQWGLQFESTQDSQDFNLLHFGYTKDNQWDGFSNIYTCERDKSERLIFYKVLLENLYHNDQMLLVSTFFKKYKNDCPFFLAKKFYIKIYYE